MRNGGEPPAGPPTANGDVAALRAFGIERFDAGDFSASQTALTDVLRLGDYDSDVIALLTDLIVDDADAARVSAFFTELLDRFSEIAPPRQVLIWERTRFDAMLGLTHVIEREHQADAALQFLASAAIARDWTPVVLRRDALDLLFDDPARRLDLLEQFTYAPPETGLPGSAAAEITAIGHRFAHDSALARLAERLLHGAGHREAAYGVERARRAAGIDPATTQDPAADRAEFNGVIVLIAGGHPPLRRMVAIDLTRSGARGVREIPSKWEAVRTGRSVRDRMAGSDLAILIGRQIAHSTADQVRTAAAKLGVPVVRAETAGVSSIRRAALGARRMAS